MKQTLCTLIVILTLFSFSSSAQVDSTATKDTITKDLYIVTKADGTEFFGYILSDDGREILLETKNIGKIYINKSDIKTLRVVENSGNEDLAYGEYRNSGPFTTRYAFTTNALPIEKGEDYAMIHLYGPEVHFAITNNFNLGVMSTWIGSPIALAGKYTFNSKSKTYLALGTIIGSSGYLFNGKGYGGIHWLTMTTGDRKSNFSFSVGYSYAKTGQRKYLGSKFDFPSFVDYNKYDAMQAAVNYNENDYNSNVIYRQRTPGALTIGISGIAPVGRKSSFIFDSMLFLFNPSTVKYDYSTYSITYDVVETNYSTIPYTTTTTTINEDVSIGTGQEAIGSSAAVIILMPAMRFQKSHDKAFQVALAGIINIKSNGDVSTYPAPMVSWLRQF